MNIRGKSRVLVIPDMHHPFAHVDTYAFLKRLKKVYSPDEVVCLGDEVDMHAVSDHDHDPDGLSAGHELIKAIEALKPFYDLFPNTKVCTSNHTARPFRRAYKFGIPRAYIRDYREFLQAPKGWQWADSWEVDNIRYEHGEGFSGVVGALNCAKKNMQSTVIGHLHSHAGILYSANEKYLIYGFNVGSLLDRSKYAFNYGRVLKDKPIICAGIVDKGLPTLIPMLLDAKGRWVKNV